MHALGFELDWQNIELPNWVELLDQAKALAYPPISEFYVGALAIGVSGKAYPGFNMEFPGLPLSQTVHAEQTALNLAKLAGEEALSVLVVSEIPCGHCRQFLLELNQPDLPIWMIGPDKHLTYTLGELLPHPFSLSDIAGGMLGTSGKQLRFKAGECVDESAEAALKAAKTAYVPYTQSYAGVALTGNFEGIMTGTTLENAAYNPTLPALQSALVSLRAHQINLEAVKRVTLVEHEASSVSQRELVSLLFPKAQLTYFCVTD